MVRLLKSLVLPSFGFPFSANCEMKSQPGISILSVCLTILGAFRQSPSPITNRTPPLTRVLNDPFSFCTLRISLYPAHSCLSVSSPLTITGHALTIVSISSGGGLYCSPTLYSPNSSFTLSTSGVDGTYLPMPSSLLIISPIRTHSA